VLAALALCACDGGGGEALLRAVRIRHGVSLCAE